jgi:hypothetical protein
MLDAIEARIDLDFSQPGLPHNLRSNIVRIQSCIDNTRRRLDALFALETSWTEIQEDVTEEFAQSEIRESEALIAGMIEGVDMNSNNQIEGFPGECGLRQMPAFGLLVGSLDLLEGNLLES